MEKDKLIVKIDIDGVIRDINSTMVELYNKTFGTHLTLENTIYYDVDKTYPMCATLYPNEKHPAVKFFFKEHAEDIFLNSKAYKDARYAITKLQLFGYKIVIVSWQMSLVNKIYTLKFLEDNGINYDDICYTKDKWMIKGDWLIDDNPEFIFDERDMSKMIMVTQPYNRNALSDYIKTTTFNTKYVVAVKDIGWAAEYIINADFGISYEKEQNFLSEKETETEINRLSEGE